MRKGTLLLVSLLAIPPCQALTIEYAADRAEALLACDRPLYRGNRSEAQACYAALLDDEDLRTRAEAARAIGDLRAANGFFQSAIDQYPEDPAVRARWAALFEATHQDNEAVKLYQESLELDPKYAPAILGLARISAQRFEGRARESVAELLEESPDDLGAHLLLARMDLEDGAVDAADETLDEALAIAERRDLPPLEIYALKASVDLLRGTPEGEWTARALDYNPAYGDIYATPAHFYVITRRYREAIELYRKAVEIEPTLYEAHAELGVNLLRENRVDEAQRHLATAYQGDPYSARTVNTLRLIDSFDNFVVTRHGAAAEEGGEPPGTILRLHRDEAELLEPYVLDLVDRSVATFSERYGFELAEPVIVEFYPDHDDFAVRTSGLPGIGLLGVTFGYLVAMDSPSGRPPGDFHWGTTLWHELAHVFTLEATGHLVPRWFSEGISVYEEWSTGPLPGRHIPVQVFTAMKEDKLLPIAELDRGFIRPTYESQVIVSYMQAGLICEYIAANWGQQSLERILKLFGEGYETEAAIEQALEITASDFDEHFAQHIEDEFGELLDNFGRWGDAMRAAAENAAAGAWSEALTDAELAMALYPEYTDDGSPYLIAAQAHDELGNAEASTAALRRYHELGGHDPAALFELASRAVEAGDTAESIRVLEDMLMVAPLHEELHATLGESLLAAERAPEALREFQALYAMQPHDLAAVHYRLAQSYLALGEPARGREHLLYALEIAPHYREAQQLLLETVR